MSWLRSLLLICVMTVILYGVYAWLVGGPATPPGIIAGGGTTEQPEVDLGTPPDEGEDPFANLRSTPQDNGAVNHLTEGTPADPPGGAPGKMTDNPLPGDPLYQTPGLGPDNPLADGGSAPRYGGNTATEGAPNSVHGQPKNTHEQFLAAVQEADALIAQNRLADAHLALSKWYGNDRLFEDDEKKLYEYLDGLAGAVVYSRQHLLEPEYKVQVGETLATIADEYKISAELLSKINSVPVEAPLTPGTALKVIRGPFKAEVNLKRRELTLLMSDGRYAGRFAIGVGLEVPPQEGMFAVTNKIPNPAYKGGASPVDGGDPNNPLGDRLLEIGTDQYAIHGTNDPNSIGPRPCKEGCIRLSSRDIGDVYDILSVGSEVQIVR